MWWIQPSFPPFLSILSFYWLKLLRGPSHSLVIGRLLFHWHTLLPAHAKEINSRKVEVCSTDAADITEVKMIHCIRSALLALLFVTLLQSVCSDFQTLAHLRAKASDKTQSRAVVDLLRRLLGNRARDFIVTVNRTLSNDTSDVCELRSVKNNKILAVGSTGVAVATGIYNYLKYFCNCHVSWSGDQLNIPRPLPPLTGVLRINTPHR